MFFFINDKFIRIINIINDNKLLRSKDFQRCHDELQKLIRLRSTIDRLHITQTLQVCKILCK